MFNISKISVARPRVSIFLIHRDRERELLVELVCNTETEQFFTTVTSRKTLPKNELNKVFGL